MASYPITTAIDVVGGAIKCIVSVAVVLNVKTFAPSSGEYIIILLACMFGIISGVHDVSPYADEWLFRAYAYADEKVRILITKKVK